MPADGTDSPRSDRKLLASDEPPPFVVLNPDAIAPIFLVCDHASRRIPVALGTMGLDPFARRCHLALDIGAGALTEALASSLGATAVLCQYSRLVIDCNRQLMDPGAFLKFGDGVVIPGNRNLRRADKEIRADAIYRPYHQAIELQLARVASAGVRPVFVAVHSFAHVLNGESRTWDMGVLWDKDPVTATLFMNDLGKAGYHVGDNEPYSGKMPEDYTIDNHAEPTNLPHVGLEIRQDLILHDEGVARIADVLHDLLSSAPARLQPTNLDSWRSG